MTFRQYGTRRGLHNLKGDLDRIFEEFFGVNVDDNLNRGDVSPKISLEDKPGEYIVIFELPGLAKGDVKVTFQNNKLFVTAEKKQVNENTVFLKNERQFGKIARGIEIPMEIKSNRIDASFENGLLIITLPKAEEEIEPEVEINIK